jgi:hypothetical protein
VKNNFPLSERLQDDLAALNVIEGVMARAKRGESLGDRKASAVAARWLKRVQVHIEYQINLYLECK